jgi:ornithine carbamoyltransferase
MKKDFLTIADITSAELAKLLKLAARVKKDRRMLANLTGKSIALLFEKPSLRTRVSFELAIHQLGGHALYLSPAEVGLGKREPVADVARVLARYVDGVVCRTFAQSTLETLAEHLKGPVINALSDFEHPCQALADLLTIKEHKGALKGKVVAYVGDGNNCAHSLFRAAVLAGMDFRIASPAGYDMDPGIVKWGRQQAVGTGSKLSFLRDPALAVEGADAIYTDVWTSMGQEAESAKRLKAFKGYQVNRTLVNKAKRDVILLHPLPSHPNEETEPGILDGPHSVVFDEAENRLHVQKAVLMELFPA